MWATNSRREGGMADIEESISQSVGQSLLHSDSETEVKHIESIELQTVETRTDPEANPTTQSDNEQQPLKGSSGSQQSNEQKTRCSKVMEKMRDPLAKSFVFRLCVYSPIKIHDGKVKLSIFNIIWFIIHSVKLCFLTSLTIKIGNCREKLAFTVTDGYITLEHTLLKDWSAHFETLPYPPAPGKFASYTIDDLKSRIEYAVSQIYNIEAVANGHFIKKPDDHITISIAYYDLIKDQTGTVSNVNVRGWSNFEPSLGLANFTNEENIIKYEYDLTKDLNRMNLSTVLHRMLKLDVNFTLHSIRVDLDSQSTRCLRINGSVSFTNANNNGQVVIKLTTRTYPIKCDFSTNDHKLCEEKVEEHKSYVVAVLASITVVGDSILFSVGLGIVLMSRKFFICERLSNIQCWSLISVIADGFTLRCIQWILKMLKDELTSEEMLLGNWDKKLVLLGIGCLLTWLSYVRFIRIHTKFTLLIKTIRKAAPDILFFLACVVLMFFGFWTCSYIVLGPYHVKFREESTAAETLFSMGLGDEIFATFAILQDEYAGDKTVRLYLRVVIYVYVSLFTILIFNLLIALFNSAYEVVKNKYNKSPVVSTEEHEQGSAGNMVKDNKMETLRDFLIGDQDSIEASKSELKWLFSILFLVIPYSSISIQTFWEWIKKPLERLSNKHCCSKNQATDV